MPIVIPLRLITAIAGLVVGYYVGFFIEDKSRAENSLRQFCYTLSHMYGAQIPDIDYDDEDDIADLDFSSTYLAESDEETDESEEIN